MGELSEQNRALTIRLGGVTTEPRTVNLRELGFSYTVSDAALAEMRAADRRAQRVLTTAHHFTFGGHNG